MGLPIIFNSSYQAPSSGGGFSRFDYDADTYFWDFTDASNTTDTIGDDTLSIAPELIRGEVNLVRTIKDDQPLIVSGGINFNKDTNRSLKLDDTTGITNGTGGFYMAANVQFDTADSYVLSISRAADTVASRALVYLSGSRNFGIKGDDLDGSSINWLGYTSPLTLGQLYTVELQLTTDGTTAPCVSIWIDGVAQTLAVGGTTTYAAYPSTNPKEFIIGNNRSTGTDSLDGPLKEFVFQNSVPSSGIRQSISDYLNASRVA